MVLGVPFTPADETKLPVIKLLDFGWHSDSFSESFCTVAAVVHIFLLYL